MVVSNALKRCPLCSGPPAPEGLNGRVPLVKCRSCGFVYAGSSDGDIAAANRCGEETKDLYRRMQSVFDVAWFDWLVGRFPGRAVLDIGCGNGLLLRRYQAAGWSVAGVDPAPWAQTADYPLFADVAQAPRESYDVVMCTSVLEHIPDPAGMVTAALAVARPGGVLYMSVPNYASWAARCRPERMREQGSALSLQFLHARGPAPALRACGCAVVPRPIVWFAQGVGFLAETSAACESAAPSHHVIGPGRPRHPRQGGSTGWSSRRTTGPAGGGATSWSCASRSRRERKRNVEASPERRLICRRPAGPGSRRAGRAVRR